MRVFFLIISTVILFASCSVQKRKYQKGFYISSSKSKIQLLKDKPVDVKKNLPSDNIDIAPTIYASAKNKPDAIVENGLVHVILKANTALTSSNDEPCDIITLQNGEEVSAKVLEITQTEVKYKKCNSNDGPLYIVKKTDVFMIKYANGTKELFKLNTAAPDPGPGTNQNQNTQNKPYNGPKRVHPLAVVAFILAILGLFTYGLTCIVALIMVNFALKKIRQQPDVYSGELLAKIAKIIALVILLIILFAMLFALFSI